MLGLTGGINGERNFNPRSQSGGSVSQMAIVPEMIHLADE